MKLQNFSKFISSLFQLKPCISHNSLKCFKSPKFGATCSLATLTLIALSFNVIDVFQFMSIPLHSLQANPKPSNLQFHFLFCPATPYFTFLFRKSLKCKHQRTTDRALNVLNRQNSEAKFQQQVQNRSSLPEIAKPAIPS